MDTFTATMIADGSQDATEAETIEAYQHLVDTGLAWQLQGTIGRTAADLIRQGLVKQTRHNQRDFYGNLLPWQPVEPTGATSVAVVGGLVVLSLSAIGWLVTFAILSAVFG